MADLPCWTRMLLLPCWSNAWLKLTLDEGERDVAVNYMPCPSSVGLTKQTYWQLKL